VVVELLISDLFAELYLRVGLRNVIVRLCAENVLCVGKLYPKYHRRVLRFLVADIGNIAYSTLQGVFLIDLTRVKSIFNKKGYRFWAYARVGSPASFVALLLVDSNGCIEKLKQIGT
jgi:hypothetical protein